MKFPITREDLQSFNYVKEREQDREEEIQKKVATFLEMLCKEFTMHIYSNSGRNDLTRDKKFVWRALLNVPQYQDRLIEKVKETFIGCDIIVDPLKTYLIIDWS
jgi:hypothetical protein